MKRIGIVLFAVLLVLVLTGAASAQTLQLPSIVTVGMGYVIVEADRVVVTLGIETQQESAAAALAEHTAIVQAIQDALTGSLGNDLIEFQAGRANVWQQRTATRPPFYRAVSSVSVVLTDDERIGYVMDVAMSLGAQTVQGVQYEASNLQEAARQALALAVQDAVAKAEAISKATDTRVVTIRRVTDTNSIKVFNPSDPLLIEQTPRTGLPYEITVERGQILVQVEVTVEFELAVL